MASEACCERKPAAADYTPQGRYETVAGFKTYIVGPEQTASKAIIDIYDIFGITAQALQGADRLSALVNDCIVLVPDFFEGPGAKPSWFGSNADPEAKAAMSEFRSTKAEPTRNVAALARIRKEVGQRWPRVDQNVGVFGLCWGGKIAALACGEDNIGAGRNFTVSGTAHPARLEAKDVEALKVPYICLASPGEPADVVAQIKDILSRPGRVGEVETYESMFHGWMGARANLADEKNRKEYERGYQQVASFYAKHL